MSFQGRKLLVIGTSSEAQILDSMSLLAAFNVSLEVPKLKPGDAKQVLFLTFGARSNLQFPSGIGTLIHCSNTCGSVYGNIPDLS